MRDFERAPREGVHLQPLPHFRHSLPSLLYTCRHHSNSYLLAAAVQNQAAVDTARDRQLCLSSIRLMEFRLLQKRRQWTLPPIDSYLRGQCPGWRLKEVEAAVDTALDRQLPFSSSNRMPLSWVTYHNLNHKSISLEC